MTLSRPGRFGFGIGRNNGGSPPVDPLAVEALTYRSLDFEALGLKKGAGQFSVARDTARYAVDHEGIYHSVDAYVAAWSGARYVKNEAGYSEDFSNAYWTTSNVSITESSEAPPDGLTACWEVSSPGMNGYIEKSGLSSGLSIRSIYARTVAGTGTVSVACHNSTPVLKTLTTSWQRISIASSDGGSSTGNLYPVDFRAGGATLDTVIITGAMFEKPFGRSDTSTPSEYCPTDTVGAGDPSGSKVFFSSNGTSVSSNIVTEGLGSLLDPVPMLDNNPSATNDQIRSNDLANAEWTATNMTVGDQDETGIDGLPSSACTLTAAAANATLISNAITASSGTHATKWYIKRSVGTGTVELTLDNGSTWQNITSDIDSSFSSIAVDQAALTNPQIGIRIVTNTDAVIVGNAECHLNKGIPKVLNAAPIFANGSAESVAADGYSIPVANHNNNESAVFVEFSPLYNYDDKSSHEQIYGPYISGSGVMYDRSVNGAIATSNNATVYTQVTGLTYQAGDVLKVGVIYSALDNSMRICVDGVWSSIGTFSAHFVNTDIRIIHSNYPMKARNLKVFHITGNTNQEAKIDELMA